MVSRASHCHQTPHALRPQSGPVTRPIRPKSTAISPRAAATRSDFGSPLEQVERARDAADEDGREHREPRRHVEIEDLLDEAHRRLVVGASAIITGAYANIAAVATISGTNAFFIMHSPCTPACPACPACPAFIPSSAARTSRARASRTRRRSRRATPIHISGRRLVRRRLQQRRRSPYARNDHRNGDRIQQDRQHHVARPRADEHRREQRPDRREADGAGDEQRREQERPRRSIGAWNSSATSGHEHRFGEQQQQHDAEQLADVDARDAPPARAAAPAASRCSARARTSARAPACPRKRWQSTGCRPAASSGGRPSFTARTRTPARTTTAKNSVVYRISRLFASMATSFRRTSRATRANISGAPDERSVAGAQTGRGRLVRYQAAVAHSATRVTRPSATSRSCVATTTIAPSAASCRRRFDTNVDRAIVQAGERFVHQHQPRLVQQRALERETLAHAAREAGYVIVGPI